MGIVRTITAKCDSELCHVDQNDKSFVDNDDSVVVDGHKIFHLHCLSKMPAIEFISKHLSADVKELLKINEGKYVDIVK